MSFSDGFFFKVIVENEIKYYICRHLGHTFQIEAPINEIESEDYESITYNDENGDPLEDPIIETKTRWISKDEKISIDTISNYFINIEKSSNNYKEFIAQSYGKTANEIELFKTHLELKDFYNGVDFNQMFIGTFGMVQKPMDECLGKTIIHRLDGTIVVIK